MMRPPKRILYLIPLLFLLILIINKNYDDSEIVALQNPDFKRLDKRTRMDLAAEQEFERTKDPALGIVPRNRLYEAYKVKERMKSQKGGEIFHHYVFSKK